MSRRLKKSIVADIRSAPGFDKELFEEVLSWCRKHEGDVNDFIGADELPPKQFDAWAAGVQRYWERKDARKALVPDERRWFYKDQNEHELVDNCLSLCSELLIQSRKDDAYRLYKIIDIDDKLVSPVQTDSELDIARLLAPTLKQEDCIINLAKAHVIASYFQIYGELTPTPMVCARPDDDGWCLHRIGVVPDPGVEWPLIREFIARMDDGDAFSAMLYGIYSGEYRGRQTLWLHGREGQDGKSSFFKSFAKMFGPSSTSLDNNQLKNTPQFVGSLLVDKSFAYVPDCNNSRLLLNEIFKSLSNPGTDPVVINHKFGKMLSTELEARVVVLSNLAPDITGEGHNTSRTLWITIDPLPESHQRDPDYSAKVWDELPGFLNYAQQCFAARCTGDYAIQVNEAVQRKVVLRISDTNEPFLVVLERHFAIDPDGTYKATEFSSLLQEQEKWGGFEIENFREWLIRSYGIEKVEDGQGSYVYTGIRKRGPKDRQKAKLSLVE